MGPFHEILWGSLSFLKLGSLNYHPLSLYEKQELRPSAYHFVCVCVCFNISVACNILKVSEFFSLSNPNLY